MALKIIFLKTYSLSIAENNLMYQELSGKQELSNTKGPL